MTHVSLSKGKKLCLSPLCIRDLQKIPASAWPVYNLSVAMPKFCSSIQNPVCLPVHLLIYNIAHVIISFKCRGWKMSFVRHLHAGSCLLDVVIHWNCILPVKILFKHTCLFWSASLSQGLYNVTLKGNKEPCDTLQELAPAAGSLYQL